MKKKKFSIFLFIIYLLSISINSGCSHFEPLTINTPNINERMKAYFEADAMAVDKGTYFEAKLLKSVKTKAFGSTVYHYQLVVAPCTQRPLRAFTFLVYPSDALTPYFENDYPANDMGGSPDERAIYTGISTVDQINPIECRLSWSNLGDAVQQRAGISEAQFDEGMKEIRIQVFYDTVHTEWLTLRWTAAHTFLDDPSDPQVQNDLFLRHYFRNGERIMGRHYYPFTGDAAP